MNNLDERVFAVLEFDKVKERIISLASCSLGKEQLRNLAPCSSIIEANQELETVDEAEQVLYRAGALPFGGITDTRADLQKAAIGGILSGESLIAIASFISGGRNVRQAIERVVEMFPIPRLLESCGFLFDARRVEQEIRQAIDDDGSVFDNASPELRKIRHAKRAAEAKVRQILEQMQRTHQKYLQEPVIAMRGNSYCLPVRVDSKGQIRGIVRDYSASGSTVFIEPQAVIEATEQIRSLSVDEEREIERILHQLSGIVAGISDELTVNAAILGQIDGWFARAEYAKREACIKPVLNADGVWEMPGSRHPLLDKSSAVPIDIFLGESFKMLIVTGPNTGGKTVTLKTIGMLTLLAMSGCFLPTKTTANIAWCDQIFVDIGDEQSIEQSLSTFSSHMQRIVRMLERVESHCLVLLDELGAGTDPGEGSALAIAILDYLNGKDCRVVATTHYAELKGYAFTEPNAINASVEFDVDTLKPTYKLQIGVPGRSNALAIAKRLGLKDTIIERARTLVGAGDTRTENLIAQMEKARKQAENARDEAEEARNEAESLRAKWQSLHDNLNEQSEKMRADSALRASKVIETAEHEAQRIITELRRIQKSGNVKDHELVQLRKGLEAALPEQKQGMKKRTQRIHVAVGDHVRVLSLGQKGDIIEVSQDGKSATVQLGLLRMKVDTTDIEILSTGKAQQVAVTTRYSSMAKDIKMELDVRGETVDGAIARIDKYIDDAVISGLHRIVIIHGKGTGALRDAVRKYLTVHPQVATKASGGAGEGGDGVTVVQIRS